MEVYNSFYSWQHQLLDAVIRDFASHVINATGGESTRDMGLNQSRARGRSEVDQEIEF